MENFKALCEGNWGVAVTDEVTLLTYHWNIFYRMIKDVGIYTGDMINGDGTSGESIYGMVYEDEDFDVTHDIAYLLTTVGHSASRHTNNSKFMITLNSLIYLDDVSMVFGKLINGTEYLDLINDECADPSVFGESGCYVAISDCLLENPYPQV